MCSRDKKYNATLLINRFFNDKGEWEHEQNITRYADISIWKHHTAYSKNHYNLKLTAWFNEEKLKQLLREQISYRIKWDIGLNNDEHPFNELYSVAMETYHSRNKKVMLKLKELADKENQEFFDSKFPQETHLEIA